MVTVKILLEVLEERYKDKLPTDKVDDYDLGRLIGQQDVVRYILQVLDKDEYDKKKVKK